MTAGLPAQLASDVRLGQLKHEAGEVPLPDGEWVGLSEEGDGWGFSLPDGIPADANWLTCDFLLDAPDLLVLLLELQEGDAGPRFEMTFGLLNHCQARMRLPLTATAQNRWRLDREGAWLKPLCGGDPVDPAAVRRIRLTVARISGKPCSLCRTPLTMTAEPPPLLEDPLLPHGPLLDAFGQASWRQWASRTVDEEQLRERMTQQRQGAKQARWPDGWSVWGGWAERQLPATGWFYAARDDDRWWLVDPDGHVFWSAGLDCIRNGISANVAGLTSALSWQPEPVGDYAPVYDRTDHVDYLKANLIRVFGDSWHQAWTDIVPGLLRQWGFNSFGNWSDTALASRERFPYVRPLQAEFSTPSVFRDFPDVFDEDSFDRDAATLAEQLRETLDDPALIGYFLMNEPKWGFASLSPAEGMLRNTVDCHTRRALLRFLQQRYANADALKEAWGGDVGFESLADSIWSGPLTHAAQEDLCAFSEIMVDRLFGGLSEACRNVDPHHLNLGVRYYIIPPEWAWKGMRHFDVYSQNSYTRQVPAEDLAQLSTTLDLPVLIGEWHFGALDAGLPASGIGHVPSQADRGAAYRVYLEHAAAQPWCVGVHYFTLYDQSALGRFDGENFNIGFLDICHNAYPELADAARAAHERLYDLAVGRVEPFADAPTYLPRLFS